MCKSIKNSTNLQHPLIYFEMQISTSFSRVLVQFSYTGMVYFTPLDVIWILSMTFVQDKVITTAVSDLNTSSTLKRWLKLINTG